MRNHRVANNVLFTELDNSDLTKIAEAMNGINQTVLATKHFHIGLFRVANQQDL
jgi:hypothetical protein